MIRGDHEMPSPSNQPMDRVGKTPANGLCIGDGNSWQAQIKMRIAPPTSNRNTHFFPSKHIFFQPILCVALSWKPILGCARGCIECPMPPKLNRNPGHLCVPLTAWDVPYQLRRHLISVPL